MGIHDRDYYRESPGRWGAFGSHSATTYLIACTCGVFVFQMLTGQSGRSTSPVTEAGVFSVPDILAGEFWRLFTPMFLHADLVHLGFNMLTLYFAGREVEAVYGPRETTAFYLLSGVLVSVGQLAVDLSMYGRDYPGTSLGASGAVLAALVLFVCHYPYRTVYYLFFPMPAWVLLVVYVGMDLAGAAGMRGRTGVAHTAHLLGAAVGFLYFQQGVRILDVAGRVGGAVTRRRQPRLRVYAEPVPVPPAAPIPRTASEPRPALTVDEQLEARLDRVLEKVARTGRSSLDSDETALLLRASEIYKSRRS